MKKMIVPLQSVTWLFFLVTFVNCETIPPGFSFIGAGYDLIFGNPDGGNLEVGGVDPGIKTTMKGLELTYAEDSHNVADEVIYVKRLSCTNSTNYEMFTGAKSYQKKLSTEVSAEASGGGFLYEFSFSASAGYEEANQQTNKEGNVFFEENVVCNLGTVGYRLDVAKNNGYSVSRDFASAVCSLPEKYSKTAYKKFIARWGTHLITKVAFGTKYTKRYKMSRKQFFTKAMKSEYGSVSAGGGGFGFSASVEVSVEKFKSEAESKEDFGESYTEIISGTTKVPSPIQIEITPIFRFIKKSFFLDNCPGRLKSKKITKERVGVLRDNMKKALERYPSWVGAQQPYDPNMSIPLTWPVGFYGLPMAAEGCPSAKNFKWHKGASFWGNYENTYKLAPYNHFPADTLSHTTAVVHNKRYCVKTANDNNALLDWPAGSYCIMKKGPKCPSGFGSSMLRLLSSVRFLVTSIHQGDHMQEGTMPESRFHWPYTDRYFCCRDDGFASNGIYLPIDKPFYLFPITHECQQVHGMTATREWFQWGKATKLMTGADNARLHPISSLNKEFYCYYEKED